MESELPERIRERLADLKLSARRASIRAGLSPDAVRTILSGASRSPKGSTLQALAVALETDVAFLLGGDAPASVSVTKERPVRLAVHGEARAGHWYERDVAQRPGWGVLNVPELSGYSKTRQFAVIMADDSMSQIFLDGTYLHVIEVSDGFPYSPAHGDLVLVQASRGGGTIIETSARQVSIEADSNVYLRSRNRDRVRNSAHHFAGTPNPHFPNQLRTPDNKDWVAILGQIVRGYIDLGGAPLFETDWHEWPSDHSQDPRRGAGPVAVDKFIAHPA